MQLMVGPSFANLKTVANLLWQITKHSEHKKGSPQKRFYANDKQSLTKDGWAGQKVWTFLVYLEKGFLLQVSKGAFKTTNSKNNLLTGMLG